MHPIHAAELLSIGSELTVGETRDTNTGELARALTEYGVEILRITSLPDDLGGGHRGVPRPPLDGADLVVSRRAASGRRPTT